MLTFDQVTKQFTQDSYGVREVTFNVNPGEFLFITGHSGSGKTTLMRLLTKEYTPTEGEIVFEDFVINEVKNSQLHKLRRRIGVVFQNYRLLPELNVWENIALPLSIVGKGNEEIEERVTDLLKLVELTDKALLFPRQLSGGEAQRISIARALATGPSVIFADEPTGNLDKDTSLRISRLLNKINELGTTIIFATHDTNVLSEFKGLRTLHLENGELVKETGKRKKSSSNKTSESSASDTAESTEKKEKNNDKDDSEDSKETQEKDTAPEEETDDKKKQPSGGLLSKLFGKNKQKQKKKQPLDTTNTADDTANEPTEKENDDDKKVAETEE